MWLHVATPTYFRNVNTSEWGESHVGRHLLPTMLRCIMSSWWKTGGRRGLHLDFLGITKQSFMDILKRHHSMKTLIEFRLGLGSQACYLFWIYTILTLGNSNCKAYTLYGLKMIIPVYCSWRAKASVNQKEWFCSWFTALENKSEYLGWRLVEQQATHSSLTWFW